MSRNRSIPVGLAFGVAMLLGTMTVAAAGTTEVTRCDGVRLRTGPSTTYATRTIVAKGTQLTVESEVAGTAWSTLCGGKTYYGRTWDKVSAVDGVSVQSQFGVDHLYVAAGLVRPVGAVSSTAPELPTSPPVPSPTAAPTQPPSPTPTPLATEPSPTAAPATARPSGSPAARPPVTPTPTTGAVAPTTTGSSGPTALLSMWPLGVVVLAVLSVILTTFAFLERRRRDRVALMHEVSASRLKDLLE